MAGLEDNIVASYKKLGNVTMVATELNLPYAEVSTVVQTMPDRELYRRRGQQDGYDKEELKDFLRTAAQTVTGNDFPLTIPAYRAIAPQLGLPSVEVYIRAFDSFANACAAAGVKHNPAKEGTRQYSDEDCDKAIRLCAKELGKRPSYRMYEEWAKDRDMPSGPTIRARNKGKWSPAIKKAFDAEQV